MADHDRLRRLADELAIRYQDGQAVGPGLYQQLIAELGRTRRDPTDGGGRTGGPGSRPPGWRSDVSQLLTTIRHGVATHLASIDRPPTRITVALQHRPPLSPVAYDLELLPDLAVDWDQLDDDLTRWAAQARLTLGYTIRTVDLPQVDCRKRVLTRSGWRETGCGRPTLRVAADASSPVWCGNPDCHDSTSHPDCTRKEDGTWSCRRTTHDTRHAIRWTQSEWLTLWAAQQKQEAG